MPADDRKPADERPRGPALPHQIGCPTALIKTHGGECPAAQPGSGAGCAIRRMPPSRTSGSCCKVPLDRLRSVQVDGSLLSDLVRIVVADGIGRSSQPLGEYSEDFIVGQSRGEADEAMAATQPEQFFAKLLGWSLASVG